jgi:hypothetical protein
MSIFTKMKLIEAIPLAEKLFESFGLISMIALKDNEWTNVVTIIHLTRRKVDDLNNEYRFLEERLGKIDNDNFKIILQARPVQEFHTVVTELQTGYLKIGDIQTKLLAKDPQKIVDQGIGYPSWILRIGEYAEYECYGTTLLMDYTPIQLLSNFQILASSLGLRDWNELARSWLGLDSAQYAANIYIIIPVYATVGEIQYQGGNEIKITLKMDSRLFDGSHVWLIRSGQGDRAPILERRRYELASCDKVLQDGFIYTTLRHNFSAIGLNDKLSVSLANSELGLIAQKEGWAFPFPSETSDSFSKALALFDAGKKMEEHLLNPREPEDLVAAFSWLLEMINIASLQLGRDETVREGLESKGSADIIACYRESDACTILAIDCTIGVPDEPKIDKIRNTADYISRKIGLPVKAVIVTSQKSVTTKELGQKFSIKIIDNTDLDRMIGFYKKSHPHPARQVILGD